MVIAIKSEVDSRVLVYPLMKALHNFGSMCILSTNKQIARLVDDEQEGGFRNIRIIVDPEGSYDEMLYQYGILPDKDYDFLILDNVEALEYDLCLIPLGYQHSEIFDEDIEMILTSDENNAFAIQFGKSKAQEEAAKRKAQNKKKQPVKKGPTNSLEDYDPAAKFHVQIEDKKGQKIKPQSVKFPTYQEIEDLEGERKFTPVDATLTDILYEIMGKHLHVDKMRFRKEAQSPDESSGYIKGRNNFRG